MNWFNHQTIGWIITKHYVTKKLMWPAFFQIFSGFSGMMWSSETFQMGPNWQPNIDQHGWFELDSLPNSAFQNSEVVQRSKKKMGVSTPMPEAFQRCFIGCFNYFNSFHQLDHLHGMDILQWSGWQGPCQLCFYTASHNIAAATHMFVDFYYGKMLLLKWS